MSTPTPPPPILPPLVSDERITENTNAWHPVCTIIDPDKPEWPFDVNAAPRHAARAAMKSIRNEYEADRLKAHDLMRRVRAWMKHEPYCAIERAWDAEIQGEPEPDCTCGLSTLPTEMDQHLSS
jgi:hypothetical protein